MAEDQRIASPAGVALGLEAAVKLRGPASYASTPMVRELAVRVCRSLGLEAEECTMAELCVRVRDVGMIGLPDRVAATTGALSSEDWGLVTRHPVIGAEMLEGIGGMDEVASIVRCHHERWDGDGYPDGLRGEEIPILARVIATCDAFVAMATDRPHRRGVPAEAALELIEQERAAQLDPHTVDALVAVVRDRRNGASATPAPPPQPARPRGGHAPASDFKDVLARLEAIPAFGPASDRLLVACSGEITAAGRQDVITTVESDLGLTIAVLRGAQSAGARRPVGNVADAVDSLGAAGLVGVAKTLPQAAFPWRTPSEATLHHLRLHAHIVMRAAERIAREIGLHGSDDLLTAALVHDIGKFVIARARPELANAVGVRHATPEQRIRIERQALGLDHASIGGLLLSRWGLPAALTEAVSAHHSAGAAPGLPVVLRLADMIAHHAQGHPVDRQLLVRLGAECELQPAALRDTLFDLPHAGGSRRAKAAPSPLSKHETLVIRLLADGMVYKAIATELGRAPSTVRSHIHNAYAKLGVVDRAQAVLLATEMGWI